MYRRDEDEDGLSISLPLHIDHHTQLGNSMSRAVRAHEAQPTSVPPTPSTIPYIGPEAFPLELPLIAAEPQPPLYFDLSLQRVEFGYWEEASSLACLLVFTLRFHNVSTRQRFSSSIVTLAVEYARLGPTSGPAIAPTTDTDGPVVLKMAPESYTDTPATAPREDSIGIPIQTVGARGAFAYTRTTIQHGQGRIRGTRRGSNYNRAVWTLNENEVRPNGIPDAMTCAVVVGMNRKARVTMVVTVTAVAGRTSFRGGGGKGEPEQAVVWLEPGGGEESETVSWDSRVTGRLSGGTVGFGGRVFVPAGGSESQRDLAGVELKELIHIVWLG